MNKIVSIAIVLVLLSSVFLVAVPIKASEPVFVDVKPVDWQSGLAGEVPMPTLSPSDYGQGGVNSFVLTPPLGTTVWDWYLYALSGAYRGVRYPYMTLRALSGNAEVWVAQDEDLMYLPGDPRNANPRDWNITDEMCQFIADEFNSVIYPTDTQYFGLPGDRDGTNNYFQYVYPTRPERWNWIPATDNPQRVIIKIFNIIDDSFFDPNYPAYVVGFFSPSYDSTGYYDRNMIHIDNWRYWQRLGPQGKIWFPDEPNKNVTRPFVYESTVAHEFQHLIHSDWNPADDSFMNEGCSMYAELLCGYGIDPAYINYYFYTPDNSLTTWGDQGDINILADYGESALWTIYLSDQYGGSDTIRYFVQNGIGGIDGINAALAHFGYKERFDDVFHDWRLANLIRADFPGCHKYNYKSLDLNDPAIIPVRQYAVNGLPVPVTTGTSFGNTMTIAGYDTGVSMVGSYGTDYVKFTDWKRPGFIYFDGDDFADVPGWTMTTDGWWSGEGVDLQDTSIVGTATVNTADPTLTFVTKYGIESFWDFGFVQVSADNGATWTSLSNAYTTSDYDPSAHPAIIAQLPGLTDYNPDWPTWTTMSFDLTAYAGKTVQIRFRYMTDWGTTYEGWWINSATVSGTPLTLAAVPYKATFQVTIVQALVLGKKTIYLPWDMKLTKDANKGMSVGVAMKPSYVILVVSPTMHRGFADYNFQATKLPLFKFC
jgi:hypothetical protein